MAKKISFLEVFENQTGEITIYDNWLEDGISFDECMAEKLCKAIMEVAKEIREEK